MSDLGGRALAWASAWWALLAYLAGWAWAWTKTWWAWLEARSDATLLTAASTMLLLGLGFAWGAIHLWRSTPTVTAAPPDEPDPDTLSAPMVRLFPDDREGPPP